MMNHGKGWMGGNGWMGGGMWMWTMIGILAFNKNGRDLPEIRNWKWNPGEPKTPILPADKTRVP